jgi:hypothetical protein
MKTIALPNIQELVYKKRYLTLCANVLDGALAFIVRCIPSTSLKVCSVSHNRSNAADAHGKS